MSSCHIRGMGSGLKQSQSEADCRRPRCSNLPQERNQAASPTSEVGHSLGKVPGKRAGKSARCPDSSVQAIGAEKYARLWWLRQKVAVSPRIWTYDPRRFKAQRLETGNDQAYQVRSRIDQDTLERGSSNTAQRVAATYPEKVASRIPIETGLVSGGDEESPEIVRRDSGKLPEGERIPIGNGWRSVFDKMVPAVFVE